MLPPRDRHLADHDWQATCEKRWLFGLPHCDESHWAHSRPGRAKRHLPARREDSSLAVCDTPPSRREPQGLGGPCRNQPFWPGSCAEYITASFFWDPNQNMIIKYERGGRQCGCRAANQKKISRKHHRLIQTSKTRAGTALPARLAWESRGSRLALGTKVKLSTRSYNPLCSSRVFSVVAVEYSCPPSGWSIYCIYSPSVVPFGALDSTSGGQGGHPSTR